MKDSIMYQELSDEQLGQVVGGTTSQISQTNTVRITTQATAGGFASVALATAITTPINIAVEADVTVQGGMQKY